MKMWSPIVAKDASPLASTGATTPEHLMGEMLYSAVTRGALLNPDRWAGWMRGVQIAVHLDASLVAVEMAPDEGREARRWFADPVTRLLIARWHREGRRLGGDHTPLDCLSAYLPGRACTRAQLQDEILREARGAWRLRLPGVLFAFATGEGLSVSVSRASWTRAAQGRTVPDTPINVSRVPTGADGNGAAPGCEVERSAMSDASRRGQGAGQARRAKRAAAKRVACLPNALCPIRRALRGWIVFALTQERGTASKGYEISTTHGYLRILAGLFRDWRGGSPVQAEAAALQAFLHSAVDRASSRSVKAAMSFARFYNWQNPGDQVEFEEDALQDKGVASAEIVSPSIYHRAAKHLRSTGRHDEALVLTLAFRTGVRVEEAVALRVSDVVDAGGRIEVVIEANDQRALKTKTSRRILPLDVLLESDERDRLMDLVRARRAVAGATREAWLFGPVGVGKVPDWKAVRAIVDDALRTVSGSQQLRYQHLRHSAASYLIATLLLPQDVNDPAIPSGLPSVISPARFRRVADRLLGEGRLGAGAVHAVSQLLGHTGAGTTLRWYCHLLDFVLGLYVSRATTMRTVDPAWASRLLGVGPDARRKVVERHGSRDRTGPATIAQGFAHARPDQADIERHAPGFARNLATTRLFASAAARLGRPLQRAADLAAEREAIGVHAFEAAHDRAEPQPPYAGKPADKPRRDRKKQPPALCPVPWLLIRSAAAGEWPPQGVPGIEPARAEAWQVHASRLRKWRNSPMRHIENAPTGSLVGALAEERLTLSRRVRSTERVALEAALSSLVRHRGRIRLKRLAEARAFVDLLGIMGFRDDEVVLAISNKSEARFPSARVRRWLRGDEQIAEISGRSGWRGSLVVKFRPANGASPRTFVRACRLALVMLAIDVGPSS